MPLNAANDDPEKARRFRDAALPHLDDVYTLARYLLRDAADAEDAAQTPLWSEAQETPETQMLRGSDATTIRRLVSALAEPFRETFVLREIHNLSYREIADVAEVPVGTVMSRLARARAMLRSAWMAAEEHPK